MDENIITIKHRKMLQLIPADMWFAEFKSGDNRVFYIPLACFALCETKDEIYNTTLHKRVKMNEPYQEVCPMIGGGKDPIDFCEDMGNYQRIVKKISWESSDMFPDTV